MNKRIGAALSAALTALALTACSDDQAAEEQNTAEQATPAESTPTTEASESAASETAANATLAGSGDIQLENGTVRAKTEPDAAMTSVFGTLHNTTAEDITITGFTTSLGEAHYELHETVDGVMRPVDSGFVVPAGGTLELAPGGHHLMIMDYQPTIEAGGTVDITLETADAKRIEIPGVAVRTMIPGHEDYGDHAGHDHAGHDHEGH
ncbi:copper chaperone PCu(A)C [Corynebacterium timonense]|uniref:Copper(I)-binding protein n=1 Tax=Corynebacterium timonense TaxID=441500 RepID=A0A1H1NKJ9_9CORY|nr:copper chaperone PCu(A)C [Corynebacterium timonense]SDR98839.1 hypothetical protein SAMN04488539_0788 [Corynebacterium timonense]